MSTAAALEARRASIIVRRMAGAERVRVPIFNPTDPRSAWSRCQAGCLLEIDANDLTCITHGRSIGEPRR